METKNGCVVLKMFAARRYLIAALLLLNFYASAQSYQSVFGMDSTIWNIYYEVIDGGFTIEEKVSADTIINGKLFKQLQGPPFLFEPSFIREDSSHARLYIYYAEEEEEFLIMDLNWEVGDTVQFNSLQEGTIAIIDSIYFSDGVKHLRADLDIQAWPVQVGKLEYIEGVGPNYGLFYFTNQNYGYGASALLCHFRDGIKNYQYTDTTLGCYYFWVGSEEVQEKQQFIHVFPNPASDHITISGITGDPSTTFFQLRDNQGNTLFSGKILDFNEVVSMKSLQSGNYFLSVYNKQGILFHQVLLKLN